MRRPVDEVFDGVCDDAPAGGDKEKHIDDLINRAKTLLGDDYQIAFDKGLNAILGDIREDLAEFGVHYQQWFSERSLTTEPDQVSRAIERLQGTTALLKSATAPCGFFLLALVTTKIGVVRRDNGPNHLLRLGYRLPPEQIRARL